MSSRRDGVEGDRVYVGEVLEVPVDLEDYDTIADAEAALEEHLDDFLPAGEDETLHVTHSAGRLTVKKLRPR